MNEFMLNALINGVLVPFMTIFLIPRALREPETGKYIGFNIPRLLHYALIMACMHMLTLFPRFGASFEMIYRLAFVTAFPFIASLVLVKIYDIFGLNIDHQVRRSGKKYECNLFKVTDFKYF